MTPGCGFGKQLRLRRRAEFDRVFRDGFTASDNVSKLFVCAHEGGPRLGCVVSRKVGNAVARNRVKRLFREAFRRLAARLPAVDIVAIPGRGGLLSLEHLLQSWPQLVQQALKRKRRARKRGS